MTRVTAILGLLCAGHASAQLSIGNRVGVGWWTWDVSESGAGYARNDLRTLASPQASLLLDVPLARWLHLRPELGFAQRGIQVPEFTYWPGKTIAETYRINALEVGLNLLPGIDRGKWGVQAMLGANVSRRVTMRYVVVDKSYPFATEDVTYDTDDLEMRKMALYLNGGAAFRWSFGALKVFVEYRYQHGLATIESEETAGSVDSRTFERGHVLSVGLLIPLTRDGWVRGGAQAAGTSPALTPSSAPAPRP